MASRKNIIRVFEDFQGVDYSRSDLTRDPRYFEDLQNYQFGLGREIVGRRGFQAVAQKGNFTSGHVYSYLDSTTGETREEVIVANKYLYKVKQGYLPVQYVGPGTWYYLAFNDAGFFRFQLYGNGALVLDKNIGLGTEDSPYTMRDLAEEIDALANFVSNTPGPFARVNGTQTGVSSINVDASHLIAPLNWVSLYDHATDSLVSVKVTSITGTSFSWNPALTPAVDVVDNQIIGFLAAPATSIDLNVLTTPLPHIYAMPFEYLEPIVFTQSSAAGATSPFYWRYAAPVGSVIQQNYVNAGSVCYFGQTKSTPAELMTSPQTSMSADGKILKYDGQRVYRAGVPTGAATSFTPGAGTAKYRYIVTRQQVDHQGNITEGNRSPVFTVDAAALAVSCVINNLRAINDEGWFNIACATVNGNQSGAGTQTGLTVNNTPHTLMPGDIVSIYDGVSGGIVRRILTEVSATSISWASTTAISVNNGDAISNGLTWKVWRTKDQGADFYLAHERPNNAFAATTTISDNVADTALSIRYDEPEEGLEHDLPPCANFLCLHQGCLIAYGDRQQPNTVWVSQPGAYEYFSEGFGNFDIPSNVSGPIIAGASDSANRLALFKPEAYYDIQGDISSPGGFFIGNSMEGDYGIVSQLSIVRIRDRIVGISKLGPISVRDGVLSADFGIKIAAAFKKLGVGEYIVQAVAANDPSSTSYRCFIQALNQTLAFSGDYESIDGLEQGTLINEPVWFPWAYHYSIAPYYGILSSPSKLYNLSGQLFRESRYFGGPGAAQRVLNYNDNTNNVSYRIKTTAFHNNFPSADKQWTRLKLFFMLDSRNSAEFNGFVFYVKSYRNRSDTPHTMDSGSVGYVTDYEQEILLKNGKARFLSIEITTDSTQRPLLTGFELLLAETHASDRFAE